MAKYQHQVDCIERTVSSTEARLALVVLTTERKAAWFLPRLAGLPVDGGSTCYRHRRT